MRTPGPTKRRNRALPREPAAGKLLSREVELLGGRGEENHAASSDKAARQHLANEAVFARKGRAVGRKGDNPVRRVLLDDEDLTNLFTDAGGLHLGSHFATTSDDANGGLDHVISSGFPRNKSKKADLYYPIFLYFCKDLKILLKGG